jgi:hypothetical protein
MSEDAERIRKRLPDYFKALEMPWHLAAPFMGDFVDDEEQPLGVPSAHARNLFHVAKALLEESRRAPSPSREEARKHLETAWHSRDLLSEEMTALRREYVGAIDRAEKAEAALAEMKASREAEQHKLVGARDAQWIAAMKSAGINPLDQVRVLRHLEGLTAPAQKPEPCEKCGGPTIRGSFVGHPDGEFWPDAAKCTRCNWVAPVPSGTKPEGGAR